jgi:hypothetical protein
MEVQDPIKSKLNQAPIKTESIYHSEWNAKLEGLGARPSGRFKSGGKRKRFKVENAL